MAAPQGGRRRNRIAGRVATRMGAEALAQIAAEIGGCTRCPLHAGRTRTVPGEGNPLSDVLLGGGGPGAREDATGRPSLRRYLPDARISAVHGALRRSGGRFIFPMYHPAAALHQSSLRETLFTDMRGLPAALLAAREAIEAERVASVLRANPEPAPVEPATSVDEAEP